MANLNNVTLIGRITKDLEIQRTSGGVPFARFSLAIDRPVSQNQNQSQNQNGQQQAQAQSQSQSQQVDFIPVVVWNKQAENVAQYCGKGSLVAVSGSLRTFRYQDKQNPDINRTGFEVRAANIQFLVSKRPGGAPNANANANANGYNAGNAGNNNYGNNSYGGYGNNNAGNAGGGYGNNANANANAGNANYGGGNSYYGSAGYGNNSNAGNANYGGGNNGYDAPVDGGDPFGNGFGDDIQF